jgi:type IV secretion system protein VirB3
MSLRRVPFYRVLWRDQLLFGGERELVLMVMVISITLIINGLNLPSAIVGTLLWMLAMPVLRWMAKVDPMFSKVYIRQLKYRRFYAARSRPCRKT